MRRHEALAILKQHERELHGLGVRSLSLFGSVVRDEANPTSDVDLLVEFDRPVGLFTFVRVQRHLEKILGYRVDLVTKEALRPELKAQVMAEALRAA